MLYVLVGAWLLGQLLILFIVKPILLAKEASEKGTNSWDSPAGILHLFKDGRYLQSDHDNPFLHRDVRWQDGKMSVMPSYEFDSTDDYKAAMVGTVKLANHDHNGEWLYMILDNEKIQRLGLPVPDQPYQIRDAIAHSTNPSHAGFY